MGPGAGKEDPGHRPYLQHRHSWRSFTAVPLWAFLVFWNQPRLASLTSPRAQQLRRCNPRSVRRLTVNLTLCLLERNL